MQTLVRFGAVVVAAALLAPAAPAQDFPKPGPEHEILKKMEGTWTLTMKFPGGESKGTVTYKMELGGLWLVGTLESDLGGQKFYGKGLDTYDQTKKVYRSVWIDNMATTPMIMEGTYDKEKKTLTMTGDGPGPDGKPAKWKSVSVMQDDDTTVFSMYVGDGKEPMFTIVYKRKR
jgi:hypothetical protein